MEAATELPEEVIPISTLTPEMTTASDLLASLTADELDALASQLGEKKTLSPELIMQIIKPVTYGPVWQRDATGWLLPSKTLGWQIAGWCAEWLRGEDGKPWRFTMEQLRFILWWYAVDHTGRFTYRKGVLQRMKGWG